MSNKKNRAFDQSKWPNWIDPNEVIPYDKNAKLHDERQVRNVANSIRRFGWQQDTVITSDHVLVIGHGRRLAAIELGCMMPYHVIDKTADELTDDDIRELRIADNQTNAETGFDLDMLALEVEDLSFDGFDFDFGLDEEYHDGRQFPDGLRQEFVMPPFSVLDARNGEWQKRKKLWAECVFSGEGRKDSLLGDGMKKLAKKASKNTTLSGTSIFDPVLTEVLIAWFCPKGGKVIDPFAGGSVRGIVSQFLGRNYYGNDLSFEQIKANKEQAAALLEQKNFYGNRFVMPTWFVGDSLQIDEIIAERDFDFMLTCPPYADLEVYSDDARDLSNMSYNDFMAAYSEIIMKSAGMLKPNAFAAIVVGEVRDKDGIYRNFIGDTIAAAKRAGLKYYNEIILVTMIGTGALRARKQFRAQRKVVNTHQKALIFIKEKDDKTLCEMIDSFDKYRDSVEVKESVLVFLKGDPKQATFPFEKYEFIEF